MAVLIINRILARLFCAAVVTSELSRQGASKEFAEKELEKTTGFADAFREKLLSGEITPVIIAIPKIN